MFVRFAAGSAIASMGIAVATLVVVLTPSLPLPRAYPLPTLWCFLPLAWGLWAMLAPSGWVPRRLPVWGAFLGVGLGLLVFVVLNLPARIFEREVAVSIRALLALMLVVLYYFLWMLVRLAYRSLAAARSAGGKVIAQSGSAGVRL